LRLTDFVRVKFHGLLLSRLLLFLFGVLLFLLLFGTVFVAVSSSLLLLLLFLLLLVVVAVGCLAILVGFAILALFGLLFLLSLALGLDFTHVLGKVLHELSSRAMSIVQLVLGTASTTLSHQSLLLDEHRGLRVLALITQQVFFYESIRENSMSKSQGI
jgi:hypothetical protein